MKRKLVTTFLVILFLLLVPAVTTANTITIPSRVQVKRMQVKLGNIAQITGDNSFINRVQDITLGRSPLPDYQRTLYRQMIVNALQQKNIDLSAVKLNIPYQFVVTSKYKSLPIDKAVKAGKNYIYSRLSYAEEKIEITPISPPQQLKSPYGSIQFKVASNKRNLLGKTMIPVKILVDGQLYKQIYLQYKVEIYKEVLVAKTNLKRGRFITQDLFKKEERTVTNNRGQLVEPGAKLEGKKLKQSLQPGDVLLERMLEIPPLVKRWQDVTLIARVNGVEVTTTGRALEPGHKGEVIKVQNRNSGETVKAEVIAKGKVQIILK